MLAFAFAAWAMAADEPPLPKSMDAPVAAYAVAVKQPNGVVQVTLRLAVAETRAETFTVQVPVTVQKTVAGETVNETKMAMETRMRTVTRATGWRKIVLKGEDSGLSAHDPEGNPISLDALALRLARETPVLCSTAGKVDPFHLQTVKKDTVVLVAPANVVYPPAPIPAP